MFIRVTRLLAMALVLLPIGGFSYLAQADVAVSAETHHGGAGWLGMSALGEPGALGLIFIGCLWIALRLHCASVRRHAAQHA